MSTGEDSPGRNNPKTALWETDRLLHGHSVCLWCSREAAAGRLLLPSRSRGRAVPAGRGWCAGAVVSTASPPPPFPKR